MAENIYDCIIIGGGPAGLTAGIYTSRAKLKTLMLEKMGCGGHAAITDWIDNYPGFPEGISGFQLGEKFETQAIKNGLEIKIENVKKIVPGKEFKKVISDTSEYKTKTIIIATGAEFKKAGVPGEVEYIGKGVSYCATCDAPFFKDKVVAIIGGGDSAIQEAIFLTKFAKKVFIVHRREKLRATKILQERIFSNPKVEFVWDSVLSKISGDKKVEHIELKNVKSEKTTTLKTDGVFIFIGFVPSAAFVSDVVKVDELGRILTDEHMKTSVDGIYACGDVRKKVLNQVATAVGDGATAAFTVQEYLEKQ